MNCRWVQLHIQTVGALQSHTSLPLHSLRSLQTAGLLLKTACTDPMHTNTYKGPNSQGSVACIEMVHSSQPCAGLQQQRRVEGMRQHLVHHSQQCPGVGPWLQTSSFARDGTVHHMLGTPPAILRNPKSHLVKSLHGNDLKNIANRRRQVSRHIWHVALGYDDPRKACRYHHRDAVSSY